MDTNDRLLVLVADSSSTDREMISVLCAGLNCEVDLAEHSVDAIRLYEAKRHDLVLTDHRLTPSDGFELFDKIRALNSEAACILMAAFLDRRTRFAVEVNGFFDVITKPLCVSDLRESLALALGVKRGATKELSPIALSNRMDGCLALLGNSPKIAEVRNELRELIFLKQPILIAGAVGIGKPYIARFIHQHGPFANSHYVDCKCNELDARSLESELLGPDGQWGSLLEVARGGTLVLHYVETFPMDFQRRLAKYFQAIAQEMHIICLAYANLDEELSNGTIDDNLYFEISLCQLVIPDLSERPQDVEAMVRYITQTPDDFGVPCQYNRASIDLMVADLRRTKLTHNIDELIERIRKHAEETQCVYDGSVP